jgi:hypothetical protein
MTSSVKDYASQALPETATNAAAYETQAPIVAKRLSPNNQVITGITDW